MRFVQGKLRIEETCSGILYKKNEKKNKNRKHRLHPFLCSCVQEDRRQTWVSKVGKPCLGPPAPVTFCIPVTFCMRGVLLTRAWTFHKDTLSLALSLSSAFFLEGTDIKRVEKTRDKEVRIDREACVVLRGVRRKGLRALVLKSVRTDL